MGKNRYTTPIPLRWQAIYLWTAFALGSIVTYYLYLLHVASNHDIFPNMLMPLIAITGLLIYACRLTIKLFSD